MQLHKFKLRLRRLFRIRQRQVENIGSFAEDQLERNFVRKLSRLLFVRRFVVSWLLLAVLLIGAVVVQTRALGGYYKTLQPAPGGIYTEGVIGSFTNANPLYATGQVNDVVSKLLFASLFTYDDKNNLVGDLAKDIQVDQKGTTYTVRLRENLQWHDGEKLTADDVVFTYKTIQNPDVRSPLNVNWQGVNITAKDERTVVFVLPNPLSSFPYSLVTGIIPKHVLKGVDVTELRSASFNTIQPVGSGPFQLKTVEVHGNSPTTREEELAFQPFEQYHRGKPKLASFVIHTFPDEKRMVQSFKDRNITAMAGLQRLPADIKKDEGVEVYNMPLAAANMVFFKTTEGVLSDVSVRQALVGGVDMDEVLAKVGYRTVPVREPLLQGEIGYDPAYKQRHFSSSEQATKILSKAGWKLQSNGIRSKGGKPLSFKLYAQKTPEHADVARNLEEQWKELGADVQVYLQAEVDLRSTVAYHSYDALLYGISMGVDPDVFVYWHSTQADVRSASRLNLSEYKSVVADAALEAGRTRTEATLRAIKYKPFLQEWQQDAPALGLYQPRFLYVTHNKVHGLTERTLTSDTNRLNNVEQWMIRAVPQDIQQ